VLLEKSKNSHLFSHEPCSGLWYVSIKVTSINLWKPFPLLCHVPPKMKTPEDLSETPEVGAGFAQYAHFQLL